MKKLIGLSLLFITAWTHAASVTQVRPSVKNAMLGEPFTVTYQLKFDSDEEADLSTWKAGSSQWGDFTLWDFKAVRAGEFTELSVAFVPFNFGKLEIPSLKIPIKKSAAQILETPPVAIEIADPTAAGGQAALRDIKSPRKPLYFWERPWGMIVIAAGVLLMLLGLIMLWWSRRKTAPVLPEDEEGFLSPEDAFYRDLDHLEQAGLLEARRYREFYFALTQIFKKYLDRRFYGDTESLTSQELLRWMLDQKQEGKIQQLSTPALKEAFEFMDLAKFAKYQPESAEHARILQALRYFVEISRPAAVQEPNKKEVVG